VDNYIYTIFACFALSIYIALTKTISIMSTWKEIRVSDIMRNKNDLDISKMYKAGAVNENRVYKALEVDSYEDFVKVLAQLEPGFEEYLVFDKDHYSEIPNVNFD
jgi:hypothetical protein